MRLPSWTDRIRIAIALVLSTGIASTAHAAGEGDVDDLVRRGVELRREQRDREALQAFREAYRLAPTPRIRAQIGLAEQALGDWIAAEEDLRAALGSPDDAWIAKNSPALRSALETVERHLGWVFVEANVPGAEVAINGASVGRTPLPGPVRVVAGSVLIAVEATGWSTMRRTIDVSAGSRAQERFTLVALVREPAPQAGSSPARPPAVPGHETEVPAPPPSGRTGAVVLASTVLGAGVAGLAVGTVFGLRTFSRKARYDELCPDGVCRTDTEAEGRRAFADARDASVVSTIGFGVGILATGAGIWLAIRAAKTTDVALAPQIAPGLAGISLSGRF
jgi:hypothetical protein